MDKNTVKKAHSAAWNTLDEAGEAPCLDIVGCTLFLHKVTAHTKPSFTVFLIPALQLFSAGE